MKEETIRKYSYACMISFLLFFLSVSMTPVGWWCSFLASCTVSGMFRALSLSLSLFLCDIPTHMSTHIDEYIYLSFSPRSLLSPPPSPSPSP